MGVKKSHMEMDLRRSMIDLKRRQMNLKRSHLRLKAYSWTDRGLIEVNRPLMDLDVSYGPRKASNGPKTGIVWT